LDEISPNGYICLLLNVRLLVSYDAIAMKSVADYAY